MKSHAVTMPPISIFMTNVLVAIITTTLLLGVNSLDNSFTVEHQGEFISPSDILARMQLNMPVLAIALTAFILMINSSLITRISSSDMIYGVRSLTASPLQVVVVGSLLTPTNSLYISLISLLVTASIYYSCKDIGLGNRSKQMLHSGIFTGCVIALYPASIVLAVIIPLIILLLRRTGREEIIITFAIIFPLFTYLYSYWLMGYPFTAPLVELYNENLRLFTNGVIEVDINTVRYLIPIILALVLIPIGTLSLTNSKYHRSIQSILLLMLLLIITSATVVVIGGEVIPFVAISATAISLLTNRALVEVNRGLSSVIYFVIITMFILTRVLF